MLLGIIHLLCVHRSLNQLQIFDSNSVKYINRSLLLNIYVLRIRRLGINSKSLLGIQYDISIEFCFEILICRVFVDLGMNSKSLIQIE